MWLSEPTSIFVFDNVINAGYYKDATSVLRDDAKNATENTFYLIIDHLSSDWLQLWLFCLRNLKTHGTVTVRNPRGGFPHQSRCVDAAQSENCLCFCTVIQEESTGNRLRNTNRCGSADQLMNANCAKKRAQNKKKKVCCMCKCSWLDVNAHSVSATGLERRAALGAAAAPIPPARPRWTIQCKTAKQKSLSIQAASHWCSRTKCFSWRARKPQ